MGNKEAVLLPAFGYDEATDPTVFGKFDPGTKVLPAGFQTMKQFCPLPVNIVFEKDTAVTLRDGTTIYVDVFRPAGTEKVPVVVATMRIRWPSRITRLPLGSTAIPCAWISAAVAGAPSPE